MTALTAGAASAVMAGANVAVRGAVVGAVGSSTMQYVSTGSVNFRTVLQSALAGGVTAGVLNVTGLDSMTAQGTPLATRLQGYAGRAVVQGAVQQMTGGKFVDGLANSALASLGSEITTQLNAQFSDLKGLSDGDRSMMSLLSRAAGTAVRIAGSGDPAAGFASDFLGGVMGDSVQTEVQSGSVKPPADPLGEFIGANDERRAVRQGVAALLEQALDNVQGAADYPQLAAGYGDGLSFMPESVTRSLDFGRGLVEGGGISILQSGEALWSLASNPGQFLDAAQALISSSEARSQFSAELLRGMQTDIQMFRDAYNGGDMRIAGQQFGKLTTDLAQMAGGVEALVRMAPTLARGTGRGASAIAGVFEDALRGSGSGTRGLGAQRGGVNAGAGTGNLSANGAKGAIDAVDVAELSARG